MHTPGPADPGLTAADWASIAGTIVAALIGVIGLAIVLTVEQRSRYRSRLDEALSVVIQALSDRAVELTDWITEAAVGPYPGFYQRMRDSRANSRPPTGAPLDAQLQAAVEIAWLAARRPRDRATLKAVGDATFAMKEAAASWQIAQSGVVGKDIREWRSGEINREQLRERMARVEASAKST